MGMVVLRYRQDILLRKQHFRSLLGVRKCCFSLMGFFVNFFSNKIEADDLQDNC